MKFKLQKGYGDDFISIDETELIQAIHAQVTGKVGAFKNGTVSGNHIISITPDFDKVDKIYNPSGPDRIPKEVEQAHFLAIENSGEIVKAKMENRPPQLKSPNVQIHTKGMKSLGELIE